MSITLYEFAKSFVNTNWRDMKVFAGAYIELYSIEKEHGLLLQDNDQLKECLSNIFDFANAYNSSSDQDECKVDENQFQIQVLLETNYYRDSMSQ